MISAKPKQVSDRRLLASVLCARACQKDEHGARGAGCLQPTTLTASLSLTEIVHFAIACIPPNGGRTDVDRGALDPAALEPSYIWNGHLARRRTATISGYQDRAGTIPGVGRASSAPRHLVRTPG